MHLVMVISAWALLLLTTGHLTLVDAAELRSPAYSSNQSPPKIIQQEGELRRVATAGSTVQLGCGSSGADFFDWSKHGEPVIETERVRVTGQGALKIKSVLTEDTGQYECRAVNGFGSVSVPISLLVLESGGTEDRGQDDPSEEASPEFDPDSPNNGNLFPGRTEEEVGAVKTGDSPPKSKPEFLHVTKFPHAVIQRPVGSTVRLKCEGKGNPRPQLTWLRNGHPVVSGGSAYRGGPKPLSASYHLPTGAKLGRWTLQLQDLQPQDGGNYTCLIHNVLGAKNATFNIEVVDRVRKKPELTGDHPINTTANVGATATLQCRVRSDIPPHIQWLKRVEKDDLRDFAESISSKGAIATGVEENLIVVEGESFRVLRSSNVLENPEGTFLNKLIIHDVIVSDSGKYVCLGANNLGYNFRSAYLTVLKHQKHRSYKESSTSLNFSSVPFPITVAVSVLGIALCICVAASVRRYKLTKRGRDRRPDGRELGVEDCERLKRVPLDHHANGHPRAYALEAPCHGQMEDVTVHQLLPKRLDSVRPPIMGMDCNSSLRTNRSSGNSSCQNAKYYPNSR